MPEGEDLPDDLPTGVEFIDLDLEMFENNIKSVKSVGNFFDLLLNYLVKTHELSLKFNGEVSDLKQVLTEVGRKFASHDDQDVEVIISTRNKATKQVLKFKRNTLKLSKVFDTASKWVEKRMAFYPEGKTKDQLIDIQNTLIKAKTNLNQVADNLVSLVMVFNSCNLSIIYDFDEDFGPYFITIDNDYDYNFLEMTEKAMEKVRELMFGKSVHSLGKE